MSAESYLKAGMATSLMIAATPNPEAVGKTWISCSSVHVSILLVELVGVKEAFFAVGSNTLGVVVWPVPASGLLALRVAMASPCRSFSKSRIRKVGYVSACRRCPPRSAGRWAWQRTSVRHHCNSSRRQGVWLASLQRPPRFPAVARGAAQEPHH